MLNGVNGRVFTLAIVGTDVYVGGSFTTTSDGPANRVARFDTLTNTWSKLGTDGNGVNEGVHALAVSGSSRFVGGSFFLAGGDRPSHYIARFCDAVPPASTFEFTHSPYTGAERGGSVTVTVRRGGDVSTPASVDYTTDDGSSLSAAAPCSSATGQALERCDYERAAGTLSFAAGETEKTFVVLVNDDSYVEGTETAHLRLSNPTGGAALGSLSSTALEITDDATESAGSPIDDAEGFVRQHYYDFLGREPDAPGLAFWKNEIESCGGSAQCREVKRVNVSAAFFLSIEFRNGLPRRAHVQGRLRRPD